LVFKNDHRLIVFLLEGETVKRVTRIEEKKDDEKLFKIAFVIKLNPQFQTALPVNVCTSQTLFLSLSLALASLQFWKRRQFLPRNRTNNKIIIVDNNQVAQPHNSKQRVRP
jgi:hypothetical protein